MMKAGRLNLRLAREKEIIAPNRKSGGREEFVVIDEGWEPNWIYVITIETKRSNLGLGLGQCLLSMGNAQNRNTKGKVYEFVTNGISWRVLKYDGKDFMITREFNLIFEGMTVQDKDTWVKDYSVLVKCLWVGLNRSARVGYCSVCGGLGCK